MKKNGYNKNIGDFSAVKTSIFGDNLPEARVEVVRLKSRQAMGPS